MYSRRESCRYAPGTGSPDFVSRIRVETSDHSAERTSPSRLERSRSFPHRSHDRGILSAGKRGLKRLVPVRTGGDRAWCAGVRADLVSIHAARAGGDRRAARAGPPSGWAGFNPRRPRGRRHGEDVGGLLTRMVSIHAARAASPMRSGFNPRRPRGRRPAGPPGRRAEPPAGFNPRRPHGRRPRASTDPSEWMRVSIHAARAGGDEVEVVSSTSGKSAFQSTPPARAATWGRRRAPPPPHPRSFNPRRPRGRRRTTCSRGRSRSRFNPRRPRGRRRTPSATIHMREEFQSTPPARAATTDDRFKLSETLCFNPRRPRGRRRDRRPAILLRRRNVSIHAARAGGDVSCPPGERANVMFQSTPPARAATWRGAPRLTGLMFQSTPPARAATGCGSHCRE